VSDNGVGMTKEIKNKIFNSSTYYFTNGTEGEKGSGLGLNICKEFVEKNGGKIWVESEVNKGSKFKFTIPVKL
jgi:signal transduction histidine kinase